MNKLDLLNNFIDYFTSNETERTTMKQSAIDYLAEDHVDGDRYKIVTGNIEFLDDRAVVHSIDSIVYCETEGELNDELSKLKYDDLDFVVQGKYPQNIEYRCDPNKLTKATTVEN